MLRGEVGGLRFVWAASTTLCLVAFAARLSRATMSGRWRSTHVASGKAHGWLLVWGHWQVYSITMARPRDDHGVVPLVVWSFGDGLCGSPCNANRHRRWRCAKMDCILAAVEAVTHVDARHQDPSHRVSGCMRVCSAHGGEPCLAFRARLLSSGVLMRSNSRPQWRL